jgi:hypothetical protein
MEQNDHRKAQDQEEETKVEAMCTTLLPPCYALSVCDENGLKSPHADGRIEEKEFLVTINKGVVVTVTRQDIVAGLPEREPS